MHVDEAQLPVHFGVNAFVPINLQLNHISWTSIGSCSLIALAKFSYQQGQYSVCPCFKWPIHFSSW